MKSWEKIRKRAFGYPQEFLNLQLSFHSVESETDFFQFRDKKHDDEKKIKTRMLKTPENPPGPIHFLSFAVQKKRFIKYLQSLQ